MKHFSPPDIYLIRSGHKVKLVCALLYHNNSLYICSFPAENLLQNDLKNVVQERFHILRKKNRLMLSCTQNDLNQCHSDNTRAQVCICLCVIREGHVN